jgi:beta-glucosidase/6-phospho-beta-glucosidase/beta-galactosidase
MIQNLDYTSIEYLGSGREHIKFLHKDGYKICGFWFWSFIEILRNAQNIHIIFDLSEDNFNGKKGIMLKVLDMIVE